jgi:hypothetical protein
VFVCKLQQSQEGGKRYENSYDEHEITGVLKESVAAELEVSCDHS